jgi:ferredoxin-thioredoxin reductase catalytic subunit
LITLEKVRTRAKLDAETYGYFLNPDSSFLQDLLEGLKINEQRFGYPACPCRFASGNINIDRDIICPCDYRDPDVLEYGTCYCGLYVRKDVFEGKTPVKAIPERRLLEKQMQSYDVSNKDLIEKKSDIKEVSERKKRLWYCRQCGYVVFREEPPYVCPICKAKKELFDKIVI